MEIQRIQVNYNLNQIMLQTVRETSDRVIIVRQKKWLIDSVEVVKPRQISTRHLTIGNRIVMW